MKPRFLDYFERELNQLYSAARSLGKKYPASANRLGLDRAGPQTADPLVKQLMEGVAFLTARLHSRLDDAQVEHARRLLEMIYPGLLAPIPACTIVQLVPQISAFSASPSISAVCIDKKRELRVKLENNKECRFETTKPVELWPVELVSADVLSATDHKDLWSPVDVSRPSHLLRLNFTVPQHFSVASLELDNLSLYVEGEDAADSLVGRFLESVWCGTSSIRVVCENQDVTGNRSPRLQDGNLSDDTALLPENTASFSGDRLIREYFTFRKKFHFLEIGDLRESIKRCDSGAFSVVFLISTDSTRIAPDLSQLKLKLFCTPAINLFERTLNPIRARAGSHEHHLLTDRINPSIYEIHSVVSVSARSAKGKLSYSPYYSSTSDHALESGFYSLRMAGDSDLEVETDVNQEEYQSTETYISLVDERGFYLSVDSKTVLDVKTLCTNRILPLSINRLNHKFGLVQGSGYVKEIGVLAGPTRPKPAAGNESLIWSVVGLLSRQYRALHADQYDETSLAHLKSVLLLLSGQSLDNTSRKRTAEAEHAFAKGIINGIVGLSTKPASMCVDLGESQVIARGLSIDLVVDSEVFPGQSVFLFCTLLERYFSRQASINCYTELVVKNTDGAEIRRWKPRKAVLPVI